MKLPWQQRLIRRGLLNDNLGNWAFLLSLLFGYFHPEEWTQHLEDATREYIHQPPRWM